MLNGIPFASTSKIQLWFIITWLSQCLIGAWGFAFDRCYSCNLQFKSHYLRMRTSLFCSQRILVSLITTALAGQNIFSRGFSRIYQQLLYQAEACFILQADAGYVCLINMDRIVSCALIKYCILIRYTVRRPYFSQLLNRFYDWTNLWYWNNHWH